MSLDVLSLTELTKNLRKSFETHLWNAQSCDIY